MVSRAPERSSQSGRSKSFHLAFPVHDLAEHGSRRVLGAVSGPLTDDLLGRVAIGYTDVDGWGENTFTGEHVNGRKDETLRLLLAWQPTTDLGPDLMLERSNQQANPATINVAPVAPGQPTSPFIRREDLVWCSVITLNYFRAFCADAALLVVAIALL